MAFGLPTLSMTCKITDIFSRSRVCKTESEPPENWLISIYLYGLSVSGLSIIKSKFGFSQPFNDL